MTSIRQPHTSSEQLQCYQPTWFKAVGVGEVFTAAALEELRELFPNVSFASQSFKKNRRTWLSTIRQMEPHKLLAILDKADLQAQKDGSNRQLEMWVLFYIIVSFTLSYSTLIRVFALQLLVQHPLQPQPFRALRVNEWSFATQTGREKNKRKEQDNFLQESQAQAWQPLSPAAEITTIMPAEK